MGWTVCNIGEARTVPTLLPVVVEVVESVERFRKRRSEFLVVNHDHHIRITDLDRSDVFLARSRCGCGFFVVAHTFVGKGSALAQV